MDATGTITVVARWQPLPGRVDTVLALVAALREASLAEAGCLVYEAYRGVADPDSVLLLERYRDRAAIDTHRESGHYRDLVVERILPLLASRQVELLHA
jgi:quinol monooxygenase YgiN